MQNKIKGMKKSELKKELEVAKATLELAMVALRLASKNRFPNGGHITKNSADQNAFIPKGVRISDEVLKNSFFKMDEILKGSCQTKIQKDKVEPTKETPLTDLANEVYIDKQANELIDKFMPLVNGWRANDPCGLIDAEIANVVWSLSDYNKRKAAIKCAIMHLNLNLAYGFEKSSEIEEAKAILFKLQKRLSE